MSEIVHCTSLEKFITAKPESASADGAAKELKKEQVMPVYKSIYILGGDFSNQAANKIKTECPVDLEIINNQARKKDIDYFVSRLGKDDAVLWLTTMSSHPLYYGVKKHCKRNGIKIYHLNFSGINTVIRCVNDVAYGRV